MTTRKCIVLLLFATLALTAAFHFQTDKALAQHNPNDIVVETFTLEYRNPDDLKSMISRFCSREAVISADSRNNLLIVRDVRGNVDDVRSLIEALDVPGSLQGLDIQLQVIQASHNETGADTASVSEESLDLLQSTLKFKHYRLLSDMQLTGTVNQPMELATVDHQVSFMPGSSKTKNGKSLVELRNFHLQQQVNQSTVTINSNVLAEAGKTMIIGRSSLQSPNEAVVILLTVSLQP